MKNRWFAIGLILTVALTLAVFPSSIEAGKKPNAPTAIYFNGDIVTVDKDMSYVDAVAVQGDKIMAAGKMGDIQRLSRKGTKKINLHGKHKSGKFVVN